MRADRFLSSACSLCTCVGFLVKVNSGFVKSKSTVDRGPWTWTGFFPSRPGWTVDRGSLRGSRRPSCRRRRWTRSGCRACWRCRQNDCASRTCRATTMPSPKSEPRLPRKKGSSTLLRRRPGASSRAEGQARAHLSDTPDAPGHGVAAPAAVETRRHRGSEQPNLEVYIFLYTSLYMFARSHL